MHLIFDICQGLGIAAAIGVRPFLPALVAGALASAGIELSFDHTKVQFLQQPLFLLVMVVATMLLAVTERRIAAGRGGAKSLPRVLAVCALILGALFSAGAFAHYHHHLDWLIWAGLVVGVVAALIGILATQPLLGRVRARLDAEAGSVLPVLTEGAAALAALLSVVAPPVGLILVIALLWLLIAGRGRGDRKYAGLRILR